MKTREFRAAAAKGDLELIKKLYAEGENIDAAGPDSGKTALHWAAEKGHSKVVKFLIEHKAEVNIQDLKGNSPLNLACQSNQGTIINRIETIKILLSSDANPILPNQAGETAFMHLSKIRDHEKVKSQVNLQSEVRKIIRHIKEFVVQEATRKKLSVRIRPNGEVIFGEGLDLLRAQQPSDRPASGQISITPIDLRSSFIPSIKPHK